MLPTTNSTESNSRAAAAEQLTEAGKASLKYRCFINKEIGENKIIYIDW